MRSKLKGILIICFVSILYLYYSFWVYVIVRDFEISLLFRKKVTSENISLTPIGL
jgi:hypothetical protein